MTTDTVSAKAVEVYPISSKDARRIVTALHYSGKYVNNSQVHLGVFLHGKCGGVMQFGPSLDSPSMAGLLRNGKLREVLELNRMAFAEWLPRNSESRALGYALRLLRKTYAHVRAVVSFADGTQCGDGTIYRAAGFLLTDIRKNTSLRRDPRTGEVLQSMAAWCKGTTDFATWEKLAGFQFRYVFMLQGGPEELTCEVLPFSAIDEAGAGMYRGKARGKQSGVVPVHQTGEGSSILTPALQPPPPVESPPTPAPPSPPSNVRWATSDAVPAGGIAFRSVDAMLSAAAGLPPAPAPPVVLEEHYKSPGFEGMRQPALPMLAVPVTTPPQDNTQLYPASLPPQATGMVFRDAQAQQLRALECTAGAFHERPLEWLRAMEDPDVAAVWKAEAEKVLGQLPTAAQAHLGIPAEHAPAFDSAMRVGRSLMGDATASDPEVFLWLMGF